MSSMRIRAALAAVAVGVPLALTGLLLDPAAAAQPTPAPVSDFATYPQPELIPPTCPGEGNEGSLADIVVNPRFTITGGPASGTYASLRFIQVPLEPGDVVTMTWASFLPGCEDAIIALSIKESDEAVFDATDNQVLMNDPQHYDACGPTSVPCVPGAGGRFGPLTVVIPSRTTTCNYQIDATVGPPLTIIGPDGSFYSSGGRQDDGPTMLISAYNGGFPCLGTMVVDKDWVLDGVLGDTPPADLPPGFTITVVSLSNLGTELGRATSSDGGLTFVYTNTSGNTASLDIQGDGTIEVVETPPLPGGSSTHSTTCTGAGATLECTATVVNEWSTPTTAATTTSGHHHVDHRGHHHGAQRAAHHRRAEHHHDPHRAAHDRRADHHHAGLAARHGVRRRHPAGQRGRADRAGGCRAAVVEVARGPLTALGPRLPGR